MELCVTLAITSICPSILGCFRQSSAVRNNSKRIVRGQWKDAAEPLDLYSGNHLTYLRSAIASGILEISGNPRGGAIVADGAGYTTEYIQLASNIPLSQGSGQEYMGMMTVISVITLICWFMADKPEASLSGYFGPNPPHTTLSVIPWLLPITTVRWCETVHRGHHHNISAK